MEPLPQGQHPESVPSETLVWLAAPRRQQQPRSGGMQPQAGLTLPEEAAALPAPPQKRLHF